MLPTDGQALLTRATVLTVQGRYAEAERAWQLMTAPLDGDDAWSKVEEHLLTHAAQDSDRRWKFFSK